jgi:hypothetical protein
MTVAAYDSETLVTDGMTSWGNLPLLSPYTKAAICGSWVIAFAGELPCILPIRAALEDKSFGPDDLPILPGVSVEGKYEALAIGPDRICWYDKTPQPFEINMPIIAIGSGMDFAIGAIAAGADSLTAVRIAAQYDSQCRPPFRQYIYVPKAKSWKEELHVA